MLLVWTELGITVKVGEPLLTASAEKGTRDTPLCRYINVLSVCIYKHSYLYTSTLVSISEAQQDFPSQMQQLKCMKQS